MRRIGRYFGFYKSFFDTLNPLNYNEYAEYPLKSVASYYLKLIFNAFIILMILFVPAVMNMKDSVSSDIDKFNIFNINFNVSTSSAVKIPAQQPLLVIDSSGSEVNQGLIAFDKSSLYYNLPFTRLMTNLTGYSDVKTHKEEYTSIFYTLMGLMIPGVFLASFVYFAAKFALIIIALSILTLVITGLLRFNIDIWKIIKIAIYASSITVLASIVMIPFNVDLKYLEFIPLLIYLIAGVSRVGSFGDKGKKKKKGYVDM